jgi:hypothetical protein
LRKMTMALIPILILLWISSTALASGSAVIDIVGSRTENTQIIQPNAGSIELEIIGSMATNTSIGAQARANPAVNCRCHEWEKPFCKPPQTRIPHLGVDAWYGEFWYNSLNLPKWPQL